MVSGAKTCTAIWQQLIRGPAVMLELVRLVQATLVAAAGSCRHLVVENLLLRQQAQVALRSQGRPHLGTRDKLSLPSRPGPGSVLLPRRHGWYAGRRPRDYRAHCRVVLFTASLAAATLSPIAFVVFCATLAPPSWYVARWLTT